MRTIVCSILVALAVSATPARAQTVTVPTRVDVGCGFTLADATSGLTTTYRRGDGAAFRSHLSKVIAAIDKDCATIAETNIDAARDAVHVLWVDLDPLGTERVVNHVVLYKGEHDLSTSTLPGVTASDRVFEIFLAPRQKDAIATAYTSTRERDPLEEDLPDFAKAIADPLMALLASTQSALTRRSLIPPRLGSSPPTHFATVSRIPLPYARAKVHVDIRVALPPDAAGISAAAARLSARNAFVTGAHAACAQTLNTRLAAAVDGNAAACAASPEQCAAAVTAAFNSDYRAAAGTCTTDAERKELHAVDASYRALIDGLTGAQVSAGYDLKNAPRRLASLGLMTAYAFTGGTHGGMRVKVKDGALVADPLDRRLSLVVVHLAFKPYNAEAFQPTIAERIRWFAGAVVTPDFGAALGISAGIVRGLTVNAGAAIIGVRGLHADDTLGRPPTHRDDPFRLSHARVLFLGVGYNFE